MSRTLRYDAIASTNTNRTAPHLAVEEVAAVGASSIRAGTALRGFTACGRRACRTDQGSQQSQGDCFSCRPCARPQSHPRRRATRRTMTTTTTVRRRVLSVIVAARCDCGVRERQCDHLRNVLPADDGCCVQRVTERLAATVSRPPTGRAEEAGDDDEDEDDDGVCAAAPHAHAHSSCETSAPAIAAAAGRRASTSHAPAPCRHAPPRPAPAANPHRPSMPHPALTRRRGRRGGRPARRTRHGRPHRRRVRRRGRRGGCVPARASPPVVCGAGLASSRFRGGCLCDARRGEAAFIRPRRCRCAAHSA